VSNIVNLLPSNMRIRKSMEVSNLINSMVAEVKTDYILANKKSILDYILSNPEEFKRLGLLFMPNPPKL